MEYCIWKDYNSCPRLRVSPIRAYSYYLPSNVCEGDKHLECGDSSPLFSLWRLIAKAGPRPAARERSTFSPVRRRQVACRRRGQVRALQRGCGAIRVGSIRVDSWLKRLLMGQIKFGTDGSRAIIAEDFTFANVERVAQATADYWLANPAAGTARQIIGGYARRFLSDQFAQRTAEVLCGNGLDVVLTSQPTPKPAASFGGKRHGAAR